MRLRWVALGFVGFGVWLAATFGVVYAAVELAEDDNGAVVVEQTVSPTDSDNVPIVLRRYVDNENRKNCVAWVIQGIESGNCRRVTDSWPCFNEARIGEPLPENCRGH